MPARDDCCRPGQAKRRSGTHNHREIFGEDSSLPISLHNASLGLWIPAFAGMTAEGARNALRPHRTAFAFMRFLYLPSPSHLVFQCPPRHPEEAGRLTDATSRRPDMTVAFRHYDPLSLGDRLRNAQCMTRPLILEIIDLSLIHI